MNRILFVDDDASELSGLARTLAPMATQWQMQFASSGAQALAIPPLGGIAIVVGEVALPFLQLAHLARLDRHVGVAGAPLGVDAEARATLVNKRDALQRPGPHEP